MASFSLTVEDSSPLLVYDPPGAWSDSSQDDPLLPSYSGQSYHSTTTQGATATIEFYGIGITVLGGKRPQYGSFMVSVDGVLVVSDGSARGGSNVTKQILATVSGLPVGRHRAVIENAGGSPVDIDSVVIIDQVGSSGSATEMEGRIIEDSDPILSYAPSAAAWGQNQLEMFQGGTIRFSQNPNAAVSLPFNGEAIAIYGTVSPDHADMKVTLNGETSILKGGSNGGVNRLHPQVLLYYRSGLGSGTHNLNFAVESPRPDAPFIDLDSITIFSAAPAGVPVASSIARRPTEAATTVRPTATAAGSQAGSSDEGGKRMSKGALAGTIVGGVVVLLVCLALFLAWRWRRRRMARHDRDNEPQVQEKNNGILSSLGLFRRSDSPVSPDLPMQQEPRAINGMTISAPLENSVFVFPPRPTFNSIPAKPAADARHSIAPSYYGSPESGRTHMSLGSTSSATPLIRPPMGRTDPARCFRGPAVPRVPVPPLPIHSPSMSSASSQDGVFSARSSPRPRNPPLAYEPDLPHSRSPSYTSPSARYSASSVRSPQRPIRLTDNKI
ncbi:hypothetical protein FA13DRAFT_1733648 [Coprinellus micaceus]|uniref:Transmembrane protein n=1 Tax=Coprinellus micaceus TaxID=71717 RepID=A0A4Y7T8L9_COPMI|nr:hypothetical protein FA13DRAFT_1733648 [Coprinellus micaceus]